MRFRRDPNTLWPTFLIDWLVILMMLASLAAGLCYPWLIRWK